MKSPPGASNSMLHALARERVQSEDGLDRRDSTAGDEHTKRG